jgi:hypothetical protein
MVEGTGLFCPSLFKAWPKLQFSNAVCVLLGLVKKIVEPLDGPNNHSLFYKKSPPKGAIFIKWWREQDLNLRRHKVGRFTVCCH